MTEPWLWHGGGLADARARFGDGPWIDLSTGINPHAWPTQGIDVDWQRLPEPSDLRALEEAAAAYFGTEADHVCALPGTEIGLRLIGDLLPGPARHLAPSYRTHGEMFGGNAPGSLDAEDGVVILANPNNPDGHVIDPRHLLDRREWLIVDEAFADGMPEISVASAIDDARRLVIFRSFGKFFGLAGLRLGFVLGPRPVIAQYRAKLGAWPVSAAAIAIGRRAYADGRWIAHTRRRLAEEAAALDAVLAWHGLSARGACPLFRLIETDDAAAVFERLAQRQILTRPFDYAPHWLRIGLPADAAALARLDAALGDA